MLLTKPSQAVESQRLGVMPEYPLRSAQVGRATPQLYVVQVAAVAPVLRLAWRKAVRVTPP